MVAHAKARESNADFHAFMDPADHAEMASFRGSFSGYERSAFFVNDGAGRYVDCAHGFGLDDDEDGRAVAAVDIDGDGDLDLAQLSLNSARIMLNQAPPRRWLRVQLHASRGDPAALGALVTVSAGGRQQLDRVRLTMGFHTQVLPMLHFGLGDASTADVEVRWPTGEVERFTGLPADHLAHLEQGGGKRLERIPAWPAASRPKGRRAALSTPVADLTGATAPLAAVGKPVVVNFWAPWCAACVDEIPALAALHDQLGASIGFVGVSLERADLQSVRAFATKHGLDYPLRIATDAVVQAFFGGGAQVALPATFVFDARGRLRRAFYRPVTAADLRGALTAPRTAAEDLLVLFEEAFARPDRSGAATLLDAALAAAPDDPETIAEVARGHLRLGAPDRAAPLLEAAVARHPEDADLWATLAGVLGSRGDLEGARLAVERALALAPENAVALNAAGMERMAAGDVDGARRYFQDALKADPLAPLPRANLERLRRGPPPR